MDKETTQLKQLNKKLAKWRGFYQYSVCYVAYGKASKLLYHEEDWPNFTDPDTGLSLIFKWLVPTCHQKLGRVTVGSNYILKTNSWYYYASIGIRDKVISSMPAQALAEAIGKAIDGSK